MKKKLVLVNVLQGISENNVKEKVVLMIVQVMVFAKIKNAFAKKLEFFDIIGILLR